MQTGVHDEPGAGRRAYRLYIPAAARASPEVPRPLLVMLHGCTQDPDDFAAGTGMDELAGAEGCYVLYPAQSTRDNRYACWNWFERQHQRAGSGEPAIIVGMVRAVRAAHAIDASRIYAAGLSAGAAMTALLAAEYPDLLAAVGMHSGVRAHGASGTLSALGAMKRGAAAAAGHPAQPVPAIVFQGDADETVHPLNASRIIESVLPPGCQAEPRPLPVTTATSAVSSSLRRATRQVYVADDGREWAELWLVHGSAHAWSGGRAPGSFTDPRGPDASAEMLRFFLAHRKPANTLAG